LLAEFSNALGDYWMGRDPDLFLLCSRKLLDAELLQVPDERARVLAQMAQLEEFRGNYAVARVLYVQQVQTFGEKRLPSDSLLAAVKALVRLARRQADYDDARRFTEHWLGIAETSHNLRELAEALFELAELGLLRDSLDEAELRCQRGLEIARTIGYVVGEIRGRKQLALVRLAQLDYQDAREQFRLALDTALQIGDESYATEIREQLILVETLMNRRVFISYDHDDRSFAERLALDLRASGLSVWWDEWEIKVGESIVKRVNEGIKESAYLIAVLSPSSVASDWVQRELFSALMSQLSAERDITILPILVSDCEVPALFRDIKWADFRQSYETGIGQLLGAFKATP
jgi:tetratricopeptide (TPR) repeat protein